MIKILKEGKKPTKIKDIFKNKCNKCGCEFEFEIEDCGYMSRDIYQYSIACPTCKKNIIGSNIYDLEHREEVVVEGGEQ